MLLDVLVNDREYSLALGPGFFCFYSLIGTLKAFDELGIYHPTHVSGSSAGAIVAAFIASGLLLPDILRKLQDLKREDIWDAGKSFLGLLKGDLLQMELEKALPVKSIEQCNISLGVTVWDILACQTRVITEGDIATAIRASACVPLLFAPVWVENRPCYDGGFFDEAGLFGLQGVPSSKLIVNIVCGPYALKSSVLPEKFSDCRLLTFVLNQIPAVTPLTMHESGPVAYQYARLATLHAFATGHLQQLSMNHWVVYIDGSQVDPKNILPTKELSELKCPVSKDLIHTIHQNFITKSASSGNLSASGSGAKIQPFPFLAKSISNSSLHSNNRDSSNRLLSLQASGSSNGNNSSSSSNSNDSILSRSGKAKNGPTTSNRKRKTVDVTDKVAVKQCLTPITDNDDFDDKDAPTMDEDSMRDDDDDAPTAALVSKPTKSRATNTPSKTRHKSKSTVSSAKAAAASTSTGESSSHVDIAKMTPKMKRTALNTNNTTTAVIISSSPPGAAAITRITRSAHKSNKKMKI